MRILHVFKTYLPEGFAGVERVIWEIAEGAAGEGIDSTVFTLSKGGARPPQVFGRHSVHYAPMSFDVASTPVAIGAWRQFRERSAAADVIHYHFPWPMMDLWHLLAGGTRRPSLVTYHSDIVKQASLLQLYKPLMHRFLASADRIVATSPNYLATSDVLQRYKEKTAVIPLGIDPAAITQVDPDRVAAWRTRLPQRFFLFVGELRYYKGLSFLIEAARLTGFPIVVAGKGSLPEAQRSTLPPDIHLLGPVSDEDKASLLQLCEAFVFPSHLRSEAFGVALLEAAFAGKPMISCEIGTGTSFVNLNEETGLVVPPADADALVQAMQRLWNRPDLRARLGEGAAKRANAMFRAETMAAAYCDLYRALARNA